MVNSNEVVPNGTFVTDYYIGDFHIEGGHVIYGIYGRSFRTGI